MRIPRVASSLYYAKFKDLSKFLLLNVYAPNIEAEHASFLSKISELLFDFQDDPIDYILTEGDWNFTENNEIDRLGGNPKQWRTSCNSMIAIKESFDLVDFWRVKFPDVQKFTWKSLFRGIHSRIDRFYGSDSLQPLLESVEILPSIYSDHSIVQISIKGGEFTRGPGMWRFNNSLLRNAEYTNEIKKN